MVPSWKNSEDNQKILGQERRHVSAQVHAIVLGGEGPALRKEPLGPVEEVLLTEHMRIERVLLGATETRVTRGCAGR